MLGIHALVRVTRDALRKVAQPVNGYGVRLDPLHRRFADDLDKQFPRPIGDNFDDFLIVEPFTKRPKRLVQKDGSGVADGLQRAPDWRSCFISRNASFTGSG